MEAYILAERVLTAQHMRRLDHKELKYLKKYDLPAAQPAVARTQHHSKENRPGRSAPINYRKIKNLLSTLGEGFGRRAQQSKSPRDEKIDRYFVSLSDSSKMTPESKKNKGALLIRRIHPHSQQYDANLATVCHRAPCWTFNPHDRKIGDPKAEKLAKETRARSANRNQTAQKKARKSGCNRATQSQQFVLQRVQRKIYEQMRERSGLGQYQQDNRLQYSPQDLGRCASEIFKKYQLDSNAYFKKFVSDIQQMG